MAPWRKQLASSNDPTDLVAIGGSTQMSDNNAGGTLALVKADKDVNAIGRKETEIGPALAGPKRKQASVVEMLEYVKGLDIDPIKESDMLWIAEEAFNAPLPPGWTEHQDDQDRVYFHNGSTGESTWRHPMDDLFREIVTYQRRVVSSQGFWQVEDEIAELEENIRSDLADWMELFDEHGEKFFYNRRTDESRFDDPRMAVYHSLYARIKMVAKMKERLPILARAPRPEEPTPQELEMQRRQAEEEERFMGYIIKVQSWARVFLAKRKVKKALAEAIVQKGPQPLRGKMRLRLEKVGRHGQKELMLQQTTPHKRNRAATKIQARMRGCLARKKFRPLVLHRRYLSSVVTKIQAKARIWLARRRTERMRGQRVTVAATNIQRCYRGYRDRQYVSALRAEKARFDWTMKCVLKVQCGMRRNIAVKLRRQKQLERDSANIAIVQRVARMYVARRKFQDARFREEPAQAVFVPTVDPQLRTILPWTWQLWVAPWVSKEGRGVDEPGQFVNVFEKDALQKAQDDAAIKLQSTRRGILGRRRMQELRGFGYEIALDIMASVFEEIDAREKGAKHVQKIAKGRMARNANLIGKRYAEHLAMKMDQVEIFQAHIRKFAAQGWLHNALEVERYNTAAAKIQARWRGKMARDHIKALSEEALWPVKGWFEYTATGRDAVQMEVRFLPNPSFDEFKHFVEYGAYPGAKTDIEAQNEALREQLGDSLQGMDDDITAIHTNVLGYPRRTVGRRLIPMPIEEERMPSLQHSLRSNQSGDEHSSRASESGSPDATQKPQRSTRLDVTKMKPGGDSKSSTPKSSSQRSLKVKEPDAGAKFATHPAKKSPSAKSRMSSRASSAKGATPQSTSRTPPFATTPPGAPTARLKPKGSKSTPAIPGTTPRADSTANDSMSEPTQLLGTRFEPVEEVESMASEHADGGSLEQPSRPLARPNKSRTSPKPTKVSKLTKDAQPGQLAQSFLIDARRNFNDRAPPPLPEDAHLRQALESKSIDSPKPPAKVPARPPTPDRTSAREMSDGSKAAALRGSRSTAAIGSTSPVASRRTYGGVLQGGRFVRANVDSIESLNEDDKKAVLKDMEELKAKKLAEIAEKQKLQKSRRRQEQSMKEERIRAQMDETEAHGEERRREKAKGVKEWLTRKDDEVRAKKVREAEMLAMVMEKEHQRTEAAKKLEVERQEQRERRLRIHEKQKAKLATQLLKSREAKLAAIAQQGQQQSVSAPLDGQGPVPEQLDAQEPMPDGLEPQQHPMPRQQRVVHRHIHHHVHYHEGGDFDGSGGEDERSPMGPRPPVTTVEEQRQVEYASEARVRAQLEAQAAPYSAKGGMMQHSASAGQMPRGRLPQVDPGFDGAATPTMHHAASMGHMPPASQQFGMTRTQEAFRQNQTLPALDVQDMGRHNGLVRYANNVERAFGSYADSGRPRALRPIAGYGQ